MAPLLVVTVINLVSVPLFYRYVGAEMYALWFYVLSLSGAFGFADLGLGVAVANRNPLSGPYRDATGAEKHIPYSEGMVAPSRLVRSYHAGDGRGIYISSSPRTRVLHNTAYMNQGEGICVEGPPRSDGHRTVATEGYVVLNNISVFNHGSQLTVQPAAGNEKSSGISDFNLLFSVGAVLAQNGWDGLATFDLKQWQKVSGQDTHSLDADPHCAMAAMEDFRLLKSSPALRAGSPLSEVRKDFLGHPRPSAEPSLGAFERAAIDYPQPILERLHGRISSP